MTTPDDPIKDPLERAIEEGLLDNLPGKGQPLRWPENPYEDPADALAHRLLRDQGFTLPWIEERREIEKLAAEERDRLRRLWQACGNGQDPARWARAVERFRAQAADLNRRIRDYNLKAPLLQFHMLPLRPDDEIERAQHSG
ncbi:MAG: hypothetical protein Kow00124_16600 [Anaerolineae bacterium]